MGKKIYIANISLNATVQDIRDLFSDYGEVVSAKLLTDKQTGQSSGVGFVEMESEDEAKLAISEMNGQTFMGKVLAVSGARPEQPAGGSVRGKTSGKDRR
jgi:cold-inducible RNA-binding protein